MHNALTPSAGSTVSSNIVQHNVGGILLTDEDEPTAGNLIINNQVLSGSGYLRGLAAAKFTTAAAICRS